MVDWSANNRPKRGKDSIWVALGGRSGAVEAENHPTRRAAHGAIVARLDAALGSGCRVLLGYDFSFGYPAGFAAMFEGAGRPWERLWAHLEGAVADSPRNANNRFEVAEDLNRRHEMALFWGTPTARPSLSPTRTVPPTGLGPNPFATYRAAELAAARQCRKSIKSGWQLFGGVSVGSQVLTGVPYLERLRQRYGRHLAVWPQETGFGEDPFAQLPDAGILLVEIWPTAFAPDYVEGAGDRDEQQVRWAVRCGVDQQAAGAMAEWFNPASVQRMTAKEVRALLRRVQPGPSERTLNDVTNGRGLTEAADRCPRTQEDLPGRASGARRAQIFDQCFADILW